MIAEHLLWAVTFQSLDNVGTEGSTGLYNVKIFYEWSSENRFFSTSGHSHTTCEKHTGIKRNQQTNIV